MSVTTKPVHILSGFLGVGKTTLLNRLLQLPQFERTLVIVNEFGEISLDHHLVQSTGETIFELANGCACCTIRSELVETLVNLDTSGFDRVVIETTGIADPLPIFQSLSAFELRQKGLTPGSILTVVSAVSAVATLDAHEEARHQVALADAIFVSFQEDNSALENSLSMISRLNGDAAIHHRPESIDLDQLDAKSPKLHTAPNTTHSTSYQSVVLETDRALVISGLIEYQYLLAASCGGSLLRLKGFAKCLDHDGPVLLQMSGSLVHDPIQMTNWPGGKPLTRLVVILKNGEPETVRNQFNGFLGNPTLDMADREALINNPLSIPGT